jgi:hypothetical protein
MTQIINVVDADIITQIATDDSTVVQTNRHPEVMELPIEWKHSTDPDQSEELAILNKIRIEFVSHKDLIPVI